MVVLPTNSYHHRVLRFYHLTILLYIVLEEYVVSYLEPLLQYGDQYVLLRNSYLILYIILSIRLFFKYVQLIKQQYSSLENKDLVWVKQLLIGALIVSVTDLTFILYQQYIGYFEMNLAYLTVILLVFFIGYLGYFGPNQSKILLPRFLQKEVHKNVVKKPNYVLSFIDKEHKELESSLIEVFEKNKPYLNEDLTLTKLAEQIATTDKKLSTLLNRYMNTSFYDIVNKYRVKEVKEKLRSNQYNADGT